MQVFQQQLGIKGGFFSVLSLCVTLTGCTVSSGIFPRPQSQFDYPNSNITPIGRVQAEVSVAKLTFAPQVEDPDIEEEVIQKALKQKGGNILLDYILKAKVSAFPGLPIYQITYTVDGTAAKMEEGIKTYLK
jgi:hypothetical protein